MANDNQKTAMDADNVVDVKPKAGAAPARIVTADGETREIDSTGDLIAKLHTGNIIIDPALALKASRKNGPPPLTIAEALERGDYEAVAQMITAQLARAQNGDLEGMNERDRIRFGLNGLTAADLERERLKEREAELMQYYDSKGNYRDRFGGYFNNNANTYTDSDGGTVDCYGGYTYPDGSYKAKSGIFYDATAHTVHLTNGETVAVPRDATNQQVISTLQADVKANNGYDENFIRNDALAAADAEHPARGTPGTAGGPGLSAAQRIAADARAHRNAEPAAGAVATNLTSGSSFLAALGQSRAAAPAAQPASPATVASSRFPASGSVALAPASTPEPPASSFFAVDSSISSSRFSPAPQDTGNSPAPADTPDPATTDAVVRAKPVVPKSAAPG